MNSVLIFLTAFHTKQIVGAYRLMIITFALIGISFSTLDILMRPLFHSFNGCVLYFTLGSSLRSNKKATEIGLLVYAGFYSAILAFLAVQFSYRACVVAVPKYTKFFAGWKYLLWLVYTFVCGLVWALATSLLYPDEQTDSYLRSEILSNYGVEVSRVTNFALLAYNYSENKKDVRWNSVACICIVMVLLSFQYGVMVSSGFIMYRRTQEATNGASSQHEKLQKQLFIALIYQVLAPTIFFQLPAFFLLTAPFYDLKISFHSRIVIYGFSAYPLVDTLIVFNVITEYKNAFMRCIRFAAQDCIEMMGGHTPRVNQPTASAISRTLEQT